MARYDLPDPICEHANPTVRVSSHEDLIAASRTDEPVASTYCCDRKACRDDAEAWVRASTRRQQTVVVPLKARTP